MSKFISEFDFELSSGLSYQCEVGEATTDILILRAPSIKHEKYVTKLQQGFSRALMSLQKSMQHSKDVESKEDSTAQFKAKDIIMMLQGSDLDYYEFKMQFYKLICSGVCYVTDTIKITEDLLNNLSLEDRDRLLGEYFVNFMLPSWTDPTGLV